MLPRLAIQAEQPFCAECGCPLPRPAVTFGGVPLQCVPPKHLADVVVIAACRCGVENRAVFWRTQLPGN
jgi:hypothetical protein